MSNIATKKGEELQEVRERETESVRSNALLYCIKDEVKKEWNRMWLRIDSGEWTKRLGVKTVGRKTIFPRTRDLGITYVRALINNTALADNMNRYGLSDEINCSCDRGRETLEHVLIECVLEEEERGKFERAVSKMWLDCRKVGNLNFNVQLIFAPFSIDKLSAEQAEFVLGCPLKFLRNLSKKF